MFFQQVKRILWVYINRCCIISLLTVLFCFPARFLGRIGARNARHDLLNIQIVKLVAGTPAAIVGWRDSSGELVLPNLAKRERWQAVGRRN